jgi:hypothetical protein
MTERQYAARARPFGRERGPRLVLVGLAVFVAVALVKPWPDAATGPRQSASPDRAFAPASPSVGPTDSVRPTAAPGPNAMACLAGDVEQVVTLERTGSGRVQSWIVSVDEVATDPLSLHVAPITVFSAHAVGVGVCAPDRGPSTAPSAGPDGDHGQAAMVVDVRLIGARGGAGPIDLGAPFPLDGQSGGVDDAVLFQPPPGIAVVPPTPPLSSPTAWPSGSAAASGRATPGATASSSPDLAFWATGSYAIGFSFSSDQPGTIRWVRVEFVPGVGATG